MASASSTPDAPQDRRAYFAHRRLPKSYEFDYRTPVKLFNIISEVFGPFTLDAAASAENTKVPDAFFTIDDDALARPWTGTVWCNPPYGKQLGSTQGTADWVWKAWQEVKCGNADRVVLLVPSYTDIGYFHEAILPNAACIYFVRGRISFEGPHVIEGSSARQPSVVVVFDRRLSKQRAGGIYKDGSGGLFTYDSSDGDDEDDDEM